jgi:hypothetical protein
VFVVPTEEFRRVLREGNPVRQLRWRRCCPIRSSLARRWADLRPFSCSSPASRWGSWARSVFDRSG